MTGPRVAITTLGCKTNQFESAALIESLVKEGFSPVSFDEPADIYIINSCTVTARTDAESRKLVRRAKRRNPGARIVVTGCYAQVAPELLSAMPEVELVIGNEEKRGLAALLKRAEIPDRVLVSDIASTSRTAPLQLESFSEHTRAFLQIQNGCDSFCSYCIVPYARGRSRSVPADEVLAEIRLLGDKGFREIVLTGIHLGNYGRDLAPSGTLLQLLQGIEQSRHAARIRLGSLEPLDITPEFIDFLAGSNMVCDHLHIPLQSGSDTVLARMNRGYGSDYFRGLVSRIAAALPGVAIGLDVIAGFPGESDAEFEATARLIEELPLAYLHVFPFSARPGTGAASMPGHLPSRVVTERAAQLRALGERKKRDYQKGFVGSSLEVLALQRDGDGLWSGLSRNYLQIVFPGGDELYNTLVRVRTARVEGERLVGEVLP